MSIVYRERRHASRFSAHGGQRMGGADWLIRVHGLVMRANADTLRDTFPAVRDGEEVVGVLDDDLKRMLSVFGYLHREYSLFLANYLERDEQIDAMTEETAHEYHRRTYELKTVGMMFWSAVQEALGVHMCNDCKLRMRSGFTVVRVFSGTGSCGKYSSASEHKRVMAVQPHKVTIH